MYCNVYITVWPPPIFLMLQQRNSEVADAAEKDINGPKCTKGDKNCSRTGDAAGRDDLRRGVSTIVVPAVPGSVLVMP